MSVPFSPAFISVGPNHLIIANDAAKATPLRAREAIRGSPSPWKVFASTATQAKVREKRERVSVREREEEEGGNRDGEREVEVVMVASRCRELKQWRSWP